MDRSDAGGGDPNGIRRSGASARTRATGAHRRRVQCRLRVVRCGAACHGDDRRRGDGLPTGASMSGELMAAEIKEQPQILTRIAREGQSAAADVAAAVRARRPRFVLFVARGTSDHAALYAKYLVETRLGLPAGLASPSTMTVYDAHPKLEGVLVIAVSQSGGSPDLVEPVVRARAGGAITLAVTNSPGSPLAAAAEFHLDVLAGPERAVAATKSY